MLVKEFYVKKYPTDELGQDIDPTITFEDLYNRMKNGEDFYDIVDVSDSVIRERIFEKLAEINNVSYDDIYNLWLYGDDEEIFESKQTLNEGLKLVDAKESLAKYLNVGLDNLEYIPGRDYGFEFRVIPRKEIDLEEQKLNEEELLEERVYLVCDEDAAFKVCKQDILNSYDEMGLKGFTDLGADIIAESVNEQEYIDTLENLKEYWTEEDGDYPIEEDDIYTSPLESFKEYYNGEWKESFDSIIGSSLIDWDEVTERFIDEDGRGHFISTFDGKEIDLNDDLLAYRLD